MATIQNERDKQLQAATIRFVAPVVPGLNDAINNANNALDASKNLRIRATSAVIKIGMGGVATPSTVTLNAILSSSLSGTVIWSVTEGTATLSGSGNTRTLAAANLISFTATIKATLTTGGKTYEDYWTITKVADGSEGIVGAPGVDGTPGAVGVSIYKSTVFRRMNSTPSTPTGGSFTSPVAISWSDGVPAGEEKLWASTRIFTDNGGAPQQAAWTAPQALTNTANLEIMFCMAADSPGTPITNPSGWTEESTIHTIWMATRTKVNGVWTPWSVTKVRGENGEDGVSGVSLFKSTVFARSTARPSTPTGASFTSPVPTGWSDGVPDGTLKLWASTRIFTNTGLAPQQATWTLPQAMTDTASFDVMFSATTTPGNPTSNASNWVSTANTNTIWMATRTQKNGEWSAWAIARIKGENGATGSAGPVGPAGGAGAAGRRGSITGFGTVTSLSVNPTKGGVARWYTVGNNAANAVISGAGGGSPIFGDTVTITNTLGTVSVTGYWNGSSWRDPGTVLDGNLLVGGDIAGQSFSGGTFTGTKFQTSATGKRVVLDSTGSQFMIYDSSSRALVEMSTGWSKFNSWTTQPAVDAKNYATSGAHSHGVRSEAQIGVGVSGRSQNNHGGFFVTHKDYTAGVYAAAEKKVGSSTDGILGDGIHAYGGRYGGIFSGGYAALLLRKGANNNAENGSLAFNNDKLYIKVLGNWREIAFV